MSTSDLETKTVQEANVSLVILRPLPHKADEEPQNVDLDEPSEDAYPDVKAVVRVDVDAVMVCATLGPESLFPNLLIAKRTLLQRRSSPYVANHGWPENKRHLHNLLLTVQQPRWLCRVPTP